MNIMSAMEFKYGLFRLCDHPEQQSFITDRTIARHLAASYVDADDQTKTDCSEMLREDLKQLKAT